MSNPNKITAVAVPKVTCALPLTPVQFRLDWNHLSNLPLADPGFGQPGHIDLLLRVDVFIDILYQGQTEYGWVL